MPWVRFNTETYHGEVEPPGAPYLRASKRNETFTLAVDSMTRHDKQKLLDFYYTSTRVHECEEKQDDKTEQETPKI